MSVHYETDCGQYVKFIDGRPVSAPMDTVAIAVGGDGEGGLILHRHGDPASVHKWVSDTKAKFAAVGDLGETMAAELRVVEGQFDLQDLNRAIERNPNAIRRLAGDPNIIDVDARVVQDATPARRRPAP